MEKHEIEALEQLLWWLDDNVDQGTEMFFDNEGKISSAEMLPIVKKAIEQLK